MKYLETGQYAQLNRYEGLVMPIQVTTGDWFRTTPTATDVRLGDQSYSETRMAVAILAKLTDMSVEEVAQRLWIGEEIQVPEHWGKVEFDF